MSIEDYTPTSGRLVGEGGVIANIVSLLGGGTPVSGEAYDIEQYSPRSGRVIGEDGLLYNLVDLLAGAGGGGSGSPAVITPSTIVKGIANEKILTIVAGKVAGITFSYTHTQSAAAAVWNIQHNLNSFSVTVLALDASGDQIVGQWDAQASTANLLVLRFSEPLAGKAYIKL